MACAHPPPLLPQGNYRFIYKFKIPLTPVRLCHLKCTITTSNEKFICFWGSTVVLQLRLRLTRRKWERKPHQHPISLVVVLHSKPSILPTSLLDLICTPLTTGYVAYHFTMSVIGICLCMFIQLSGVVVSCMHSILCAFPLHVRSEIVHTVDICNY